MSYILLDGERHNIDAALIIPSEGYQPGTVEVNIDLTKLPAGNLLTFSLAFPTGKLNDVVLDEMDEPAEEDMEKYTYLKPVKTIDFSKKKFKKIEAEAVIEGLENIQELTEDEMLNVNSPEEAADVTAKLEILSTPEFPAEKPKKRGRKKKVEPVAPEEGCGSNACQQEEIPEETEEPVAEEKPKSRKRPKIGPKGRLVRQIATPTCTGDVAPTLMASGYANASYKNFYSVGHFPKLGIFEIWEDDSDIEPLLEEEHKETPIDIDPNQTESGVLDAGDIFVHREREITVDNSDDDSQAIDPSVYNSAEHIVRNFGKIKRDSHQAPPLDF